jgi:hypothetical protein
MSTERLLPVVITVYEGGRARRVRIGQAVVSEQEVVLSLESLVVPLDQPPLQTSALQPAGADDAPLASTPQTERRLLDLEWLAQRSRRILVDPKKARWHEDMRLQLEKIDAEMERLRHRPLGRKGS